MALSVVINRVEAAGSYVEVEGVLTASGNYVAGGDTIDFTSLTFGPNFSGLSGIIPSSQPPVELEAWSQNGNLVNQYVPIIGAALNNSKLKISAASTFGTEFTAGAYSAAILADIIGFRATFRKLQ